MPSTIPAGPVATLPIWRTVAAVFRTVLIENLRQFPRAVVAPLLLSVLLLLLQVRFGTSLVQVEGEPPPTPSFTDFLLSLAGMVPYVVFAVAWHRLVLLGPARGRPAYQPSWRRRHWLFLGYMLLLGLITALIAVPLLFAISLVAGLVQGAPEAGAESGGTALLGLALVFLVLLIIGWFLARLSFVLPARALDETYGFSDSWRQTRRQGLRILAVFLVVQALIALPSAIVVSLVGASTGVIAMVNGMAAGHGLEAGILLIGVLPVLLIGLLASYLATALGVTVLSQAFKTCSGWTPPTESQAGSQ